MSTIFIENSIPKEVISQINPTDRIHMTHDEKLTIQKKDLIQGDGWKPKGFWYSFGTEWVDWVRTEMPEWERPHLFKIDVDTTNILQLNNQSDFNEFVKKYGINEKSSWMNMINWDKVSKDYGGFEIPDYGELYSLRYEYMWISSFDISSGCVWDLSLITNITKLQ
jgi:hypothetical protein